MSAQDRPVACDCHLHENQVCDVCQGVEHAIRRVCSKCGEDDIVIRWHAKGGSSECGYFAKVKVYGEHLHATCRTCQFEWGEDTLDNLG